MRTGYSARHGGATARAVRSLWLGVLTVAVASCGGDEAGGPSEPRGTMTAQVDGAPWVATAGVIAVRANGLISVGGSLGATSSIAFAWPDEGLGIYSVPGTPGTTATYILLGGGGQWQSVALATSTRGTATITVTTLTATRVAGTFVFSAPAAPQSVAVGTRVITSGAFDIVF